ncbi:MAG: nucleoside triphosphate pyrophosphohydrolase family protein [Pirellulaceae bacterium]
MSERCRWCGLEMETLHYKEKLCVEALQQQLAEVQPVLDELARAKAKFPTWPTDPLHALAVLGEEFGELTKAIIQRVYEPHKSTAEDVRTEAIQTAAMALRFVASLDAYSFCPSLQHIQTEKKR